MTASEIDPAAETPLVSAGPRAYVATAEMTGLATSPNGQETLGEDAARRVSVENESAHESVTRQALLTQTQEILERHLAKFVFEAAETAPRQKDDGSWRRLVRQLRGDPRHP